MKEICWRAEALYLVEFVLDEAVNGFDVGLPGMGKGWDGVMFQALDALDETGEG